MNAGVSPGRVLLPANEFGRERGDAGFHIIADAITHDDLTRYFSMARMVLGEDDPSLDLDEDKRWAVAFHGKTRVFTGEPLLLGLGRVCNHTRNRHYFGASEVVHDRS
jgi:hypothetical protein